MMRCAAAGAGPARRWRGLAVVAVLALALAGCGGDDDGELEALPEEDPADADPLEDDDEPAEPEEDDDDTEEAEEADDAPAGTTTYEVQEGDTLGAIASRFDTTVDELVELNDLDDPDAIFVGDELLVPDEG